MSERESPEVIEARAEEIRARLAPRPAPGQIKTPDSIIEDLEYAKWASGMNPAILRDADKGRRSARNDLDRARARARLVSEGKSADLREAEVVLATVVEVDAADAAEVAFEFARSVARSVESSTSAIQTQAAQIKVMYGLAGTGRGHD